MVSTSPMQPFPFMRLPSEIRLMIYERIPIELKVREFTHHAPDTPNSKPFRFSLIDRTICAAILRTCRQVYKEANPILHKKCQLILCYPLRMLFDTANAQFKTGGPLPCVSAYLLIADWKIECDRATRDDSPSPPAPALDMDLIEADLNYPLLLPVAM